jgi:tetratricopeptide (TPR) repeat protein
MSEYEDSPSILPALMLQAEAARNEGNLERALRLFKEAEEKFPAHEQIHRAVIGQGEILVAQGEFGEARAILQNVLRVSEWRGEAHAHALYVIGTSYFSEADRLTGEERERRLLNAHGFFERTFVMYSYFKEWAGKAYVMDTRTLLALGQVDDARRTLDEFLGNDEFSDLDSFREAQQLRATL